MVNLNKEQLNRLYNVFDFKENEEIVSATIESERGGYMEINYIDNSNGVVGCYKPYFGKYSKEDSAKLDIILNGVPNVPKVERME